MGTTFVSPLLPPGITSIHDTTLLYTLLSQLISGSLAALIAYKLLRNAAVRHQLLAWASNWGIARKTALRYSALVISSALSVLAYLLAIAIGYAAMPTSLAEAVNMFLALIGIGFTGSQMLHVHGRHAK